MCTWALEERDSSFKLLGDCITILLVFLQFFTVLVCKFMLFISVVLNAHSSTRRNKEHNKHTKVRRDMLSSITSCRLRWLLRTSLHTGLNHSFTAQPLAPCCRLLLAHTELQKKLLSVSVPELHLTLLQQS